MAHATYPFVFPAEGGSWKCEMRDKRTGKTWGYGYGSTRADAIINARQDQPAEGRIKKAIGWVTRHPFVSGAAVGTYLAYRHAKRHQEDVAFIEYIQPAVIFGTIAWAISKVANFIYRKIKGY